MWPIDGRLARTDARTELGTVPPRLERDVRLQDGGGEDQAATSSATVLHGELKYLSLSVVIGEKKVGLFVKV